MYAAVGDLTLGGCSSVPLITGAEEVRSGLPPRRWDSQGHSVVPQEGVFLIHTAHHLKPINPLKAKTKEREEFHGGVSLSLYTKGHHAQEQDLPATQASGTRVLAKGRVAGTKLG